jgi:hypothetical protein
VRLYSNHSCRRSSPEIFLLAVIVLSVPIIRCPPGLPICVRASALGD